MSIPEERPRGDLAALRIHRDEEPAARSWTKILGWVVTLAVLAVLGWVGYTKFVVPSRAPVVETITVKPTVNVANPALLTATGYLVANKTAKITPKISGKVVQLNIDTGQDVRRGDVLAVLESTNLQAQLDEANASLDNADREWTRQSSMWREGVTTKAQLDAAEAQLKAARARVEQVRINMQDMVIRAPFDGTIAAKNTEVGEVISSVMMGQVAGTLPSGAICTIVDLKTIEVEVDVNEQNISQLREGQPAEVTVDAFPARKWNGKLRQIIPTADRAKAVVKVKVAILNPDARLLPEMSSSVSFLETARTSQELNEKAKIWLPPGAIVDKRVAVVDANERVHWKNVTTGDMRDGRLEILGGLNEGDRVVSEKAEQLQEGQLVKLSS
ncbi:MAG: efflux RND transporter periplasmic adaptor subunit [Acidobacteria bacterium]|nr:efflux RND transporter periplasmic adaptor subunit [Acidobacteriota bacterium]